MKWWLLGLVVCFAPGCAKATMCCATDVDPDRPTAYSQFTVKSTAATIKSAIEGNTDSYIFIPEGTYTLINPVTISASRTIPLAVHGGSAGGTILVANDPSQPLFKITGSSRLIQIANLNLRPNATQELPLLTVDAVALSVEQTSGTARVEMANVTIDGAAVNVTSAATLLFSNVAIGQNGLPHAVMLDHPSADMAWVGGDITGHGYGPFPAGVANPDSYHAWVKRGRLRMYGTSVESTVGRADFRVDSTSMLGPTTLADVRSEGGNSGFYWDWSGVKYVPDAVNGAFPYEFALLYVPAGADADVVLKGNSASWATEAWGRGAYAIYNGTGTLWALGNESFTAGSIVSGDTSAATLVLAGNVVLDQTDAWPATVGTLYHAANVFRYMQSGCNEQANGDLENCHETAPKARQISPEHALGTPPLPPLDSVPHAIPMPVADVAPSGFLNVKTVFNAVGDGVADDTAELQAALDYECALDRSPLRLWFPPGTYKISSKLVYNSTVGAGCSNLPFGVAMLGAGRDVTKILRTGSPGGVFKSDGFGYGRVQGITFEDAAGSALPVISITSLVLSSQKVMFDAVRVTGGIVGIGLGVEQSPNQDSAFLVQRTEFRGASNTGFVSGHQNALTNICLECRFRDHPLHAFGTMIVSGTNNPGGSLHIYRSRSEGTGTCDIVEAAGHMGIRDFRSDAPAIYDEVGVHGGGGILELQLENAVYTNGVNGKLERGIAGSTLLLDSNIAKLGGDIIATSNADSVISLGSTVTDWASIALSGTIPGGEPDDNSQKVQVAR